MPFFYIYIILYIMWFQWCCEETFPTPTSTIGKKIYPHSTLILCNAVGRRQLISINRTCFDGYV